MLARDVPTFEDLFSFASAFDALVLPALEPPRCDFDLLDFASDLDCLDAREARVDPALDADLPLERELRLEAAADPCLDLDGLSFSVAIDFDFSLLEREDLWVDARLGFALLSREEVRGV